jgi:hypothetical protein
MLIIIDKYKRKNDNKYNLYNRKIYRIFLI